MGKMIKIVGVGVDPNTMQDTPNRWEGWLPLKSIEVLKEIWYGSIISSKIQASDIWWGNSSGINS